MDSNTPRNKKEISPRSAKNSLKFQAKLYDKAVSVRVGRRHFLVPIQARVLANENYAFISIPAISELFAVEGQSLAIVSQSAHATEAHAQLKRKQRSKKARTATPAELPNEVLELIRKIPSGHKLVVGKDGKYRLIRTRKR